MAILDRFQKAWNAFRNKEPIEDFSLVNAPSYSSQIPPNRRRNYYSNERSIISSIYTKLSIDVAGLLIKHVKLDNQGRYQKDMDSSLNTCFTLEANMDQAPRAFRQDIALTMFDKGVAVIVPVDTSRDPNKNEIFDIYTLRVGEIVRWYPKQVCVSLYNEETGTRQEIVLSKKHVAIIENPLYNVMNEPNSTLQRLIRKLNLLDLVDEQSGSGKLDIIIQLPYVVKSEARKQQAIQRREDIEFQLRGSQYGIAYTDATEKITQLNRPAENNLLKQVEYLHTLLYNQLGLTDDVMNGTATEEAMINYYNRTIEPVIDAITEGMNRSFVGEVGTKKKEKITYFRDPFKLVPVKELAEIADKFTRNEIITSNEIRQFVGLPPSSDPKADQLVNSNMPQPVSEPMANQTTDQADDDFVNSALDEINTTLDGLFEDLGGETQ